MLLEIAQFYHTGPLPTDLAVKLTLTWKFAPGKDGKGKRSMVYSKMIEDLSDRTDWPGSVRAPGWIAREPRLGRGDNQ